MALTKNRATLPKEANRVAVPLIPAVVALEETVNSSLSSTVEITLNTSTTFLRIYAVDQDIYFKWGTDDVTASDFDGIVPAGQIIDVYVPAVATTGVLYTAINFIERTSGSTLIMTEH